MIISRTPFRISFFGGGTDYPKWYEENGGTVLSTTINKYCYITCRHLPPFFEHKHRIAYSVVECVKNIQEIKHPAVRAIMNFLEVSNGLEIHHDGDLPARSGIGSSSSFTVGLLNSLYALKGRMISKEELASLAIHIEQKVIGEAVGSQDQIAAAYGGLNKIDFHRDGSFSVKPVVLHTDRLESLNKHLMLFFTGFSRTAEVVAKSKIENFDRKKTHLVKMGQMVTEGLNILQSSEDLTKFGQLLHEGWRLKRELSNMVSNDSIDQIYQAGIDNGAVGGKILGAGGGGFILFFASPDKHQKIREALRDLIEVEFKFESHGSHISLYHPEQAIYYKGPQKDFDWRAKSSIR